MSLKPWSYKFLTIMALPLAALYLLWRARKQPEYLKFWSERFATGSYPQKQAKYRVWIHAVSVGETNATRTLIEAILKRWPDVEILLTHMTPTGREVGKKILKAYEGKIQQCYLPYDMPYAVERFLKQTHPDLGIVMETEVWPNLMEKAKEQEVPVVLANARESEKSFKKALSQIDVMAPAFSRFTKVLAQSEEDAKRLALLGAKNIEVCGSLKFDIALNQEQVNAAKVVKKKLGRNILLLASTRAGEEAMFIDQMNDWFSQEENRETLVVLVPRHPQRFKQVEGLLKASAMSYVKRTQFDTLETLPATTQVLLGDSMGEMSLYCALSDVTIMGGSFGPYGSQNVIEPAMAGSPVLVGPSIYNFHEIITSARQEGVFELAKDAHKALDRASEILQDRVEKLQLSELTLSFASSRVGATEKMMDALEKIWERK